MKSWILGVVLVFILNAQNANFQLTERRNNKHVTNATVTCRDDSDCKNEGMCKEEGGKKTCVCQAGTSGDMCEIITDCEKGGKYENCKGENGECTFKYKKAVCKCTDGYKMLDESKGQCRGKCKEDVNGVKFCFCKPGTLGDSCETITACGKDGKYKDCRGRNGECTFQDGVALCKCTDNQKLDENAGYCKWTFCLPDPCTDSSECTYDNELNVGGCICRDNNKYYDYSTNRCIEPDKCVLKKKVCRENEECLNGNCICIKNYKYVNGICTSDICKSNPCFSHAICDDADGILKCSCGEGKYFDGKKCSDGTCFLGDYKKTCSKSCPENLYRDFQFCEPKKGFTLCSEDCGYGYCIQEQDQSHTCSCISSISVNYKNRKDGKCILRKDIVCASKQLRNDLERCNCTGKYKLSRNGITCEQITCSDQSAQYDCKQKGALCVDNGKNGYNCRCRKGYVFDSQKKMCTDSCSLDIAKMACMEADQLCYNSVSSFNEEVGDCRCPPPLKLGKKMPSENILECVDLAENVYLIKDIPVQKNRYLIGEKIDYVLLNADLIRSMRSTFKLIDYGYLQDYQLKGDVLSVSVWIQFKSNPYSELNRISLQTRNFQCYDCDVDISLWPPSVLLHKKYLNEVRYERLEFCSEASKNILCGKEANCRNNECFCPRGFKTMDYSVREVKGKFKIQRCEDIDECMSETHVCSVNTTCLNLPGDYGCLCKPNFKKINPVHSGANWDKSDCDFDHCSLYPCKNGGSCKSGNDTFECTCIGMYGGKDCSKNIWCEKYGQDLCGKEKCHYNDTLGMGYCFCEDGTVFHEESKTCIDTYPKDIYTCSFYNWRVNWETAVNTCKDENKDLLCYRSKQEIKDITESFMITNLDTTSLEIWLSKTNCSNNEMEKCLSLHVHKSGKTVWHYFQKQCKEENYPFVCCTDGSGPCTDNPCKNGGTCEIQDKTYACICAEPFSGKTCEMDLCTSNPCQNGGTCTMSGKKFNCACSLLYSGSTCENVNRFITVSSVVVIFLMLFMMICGGCCMFKMNQKLKLVSQISDISKTASSMP